MRIIEGHKIIYKIINFWFISLFIIMLSGCQILNVVDAEERQRQEVLTTQKSLVVSFLNKGLPEMAIKELRALIAKYPDDADFRNLMGLAQLAIKNHTEAIRYLHEAYKIEPRPSIALNLSSAYIEAGQFSKSITLLMALSKQKNMESYLHPERISHNIGLASERNKNTKQAEKYYLKALSQNPSFYISLMRLGSLYENTKQPKKAYTYFYKAKATCPTCFDPVNALTMNYLAEGKTQKATQIAKAFLAQKELLPQDRVRGVRLLELTKKAVKPESTPKAIKPKG